MYAQNIKKLHPFSPDHESNMNAQARQESKLTKVLTHCGLAALLSKLLTATPAILTIWECPGIGIISGATNVCGAPASGPTKVEAGSKASACTHHEPEGNPETYSPGGSWSFARHAIGRHVCGHSWQCRDRHRLLDAGM